MSTKPQGGISRRGFIANSTLIATAVSLAPARRAPAQQSVPAAVPCFVSTWKFGQLANERSRQVYQETHSVLDAVEQGIRLVEEDASNGSVGLGGIPNADGIVQLDACIMYGPGQKAGSVAALSGILHPISVARQVMEKTRHVMLVGEGARQFALREGFPEVDLLTEERVEAWNKWKAEQAAAEPPEPVGHDTIALVGIDKRGNVAGGCSTSGMGYKLPGRVGDSPILGSGLYVDNSVGGAGATGVGENVMRFCGCFMVVEAMRHGMHPSEACAATIRRIAAMDGRPMSELHINFVAVDRHGNHGAAGTDPSFDYAATTAEASDVLPAVHVVS
jgi:isoaspartyl peptidase/L-asparaginase-like protein (Ntn-hydrolase superfamily)